MRTNNTTQSTRVSDEGIALDETAPADGTVAASAAPPRTSQWQSRERMRQISGLYRTPGKQRALGQRRFDPPQFTFDDIKLATSPDYQAIATQLPNSTSQVVRRRREPGQLVAWLIIAVGMLTFAGGLGAIGWSLSARQFDFWNLALGLTLGGQGTLIFGLALVVSRLWRNSRYATGKLQTVSAQLADLQRSADELAASRGGAPAFYAELARGASPQMLLANLKGQLDQLTTRLGG